MPPRFRRRTTKKEPRLAPRPAAALEEYLTLACAHEGETWFDAGAWSEDLADSYLALGRVDDAVRTISDATRRGCAEGAEMLCELAEKLVCSGHEPQARLLWQQARAGYPDDVWVYVQAGIGYGDIGDHAGAGPVSACDPQPSNLRPASCSACTTAATATPRRCLSTLRTTRPSARQVW